MRHDFTAAALGGYVNSTYRSLRYGEAGLAVGARLDADKSVPYALQASFALESRIRPFNKYLEWELEHHRLGGEAWSGERLVPLLRRGARWRRGGAARALFRDMERAARAGGFGDAIDEWVPDVAWLRGEAEYRPSVRPTAAVVRPKMTIVRLLIHSAISSGFPIPE